MNGLFFVSPQSVRFCLVLAAVMVVASEVNLITCETQKRAKQKVRVRLEDWGDLADHNDLTCTCAAEYHL